VNPTERPSWLERLDMKRGMALLEQPDWTAKAAQHFDGLYPYVGRWFQLLCCQQASQSMPPIPYRGESIRSQLHILFRGLPEGGKSRMIKLLHRYGVNVRWVGIMTSAKIAGTIRDEEWVPGEAYMARRGTLAVPELFQTLRAGRHYRDAIHDLIQIMEDQCIVKSLAAPLDPAKLRLYRQTYPDVEFEESGRFSYAATPACWPPLGSST